MEYKENNVVKWKSPQTEVESRDIMVVKACDKGTGYLTVLHINEPDGVLRESMVSPVSVEFCGICSKYEPYSEVVDRYLK